MKVEKDKMGQELLLQTTWFIATESINLAHC